MLLDVFAGTCMKSSVCAVYQARVTVTMENSGLLPDECSKPTGYFVVC